MKNKIKNTYWLTLIEIIVVISLIWLLSVGATNLDFSRLSVRQEHEIFTNDIISKFDSVRNFSFQGRWIGVNLDTPDEWSVQISTAGNGSLTTTYSGGISWTYEPTSITIDSWYQLSWLECITLNDTIAPQTTNSATITFIGSEIRLSGCPDTSQKILRFDTLHNVYSSTVEINTISGIIQEK